MKPKRDDFNPHFMRALRQEKGLTQQALADELGANLRTVQSWESGEKSPSDRNRRKMCDLFDVPSFEFLKDPWQIAHANMVIRLVRNEDISFKDLLDAVVKLGGEDNDKSDQTKGPNLDSVKNRLRGDN